MKYISGSILACLPVLLFMCCLCACGSNAGKPVNEYGVFIGVNPEEADILLDYKIAVVDAAYYSEPEIAELKRNGVEIYSYLNIGSVEAFRESFPAYRHLVLGEYENWPGEYWVDVSQVEWQEYIAQEASSLARKGVSGFFLDNADIYFQYPRPEIFRGLAAMINGIEQYQKNIIINGGDVFVAEAILNAETPIVIITGVNQECVFTRIGFENKELLSQETEVSEYYKNYLEQCDEGGLAVYLTEYAEAGSDELPRSIEGYCSEHRFKYFITPSISLDR